VEARRGKGVAVLTRAETERWFLAKVETEHSRLRAFIRAQGVRSESVDDLAQEALLISLKKIDEFDRAGNFGAWVRQIARRLIANERRKDARRNQILSDHITDLLLEFDEAQMSCALVQHENEEELVLLRDCLSKMPQKGRDLLHQRYFEELSPSAIGSRLGQSSNQIRQALLRLRKLLLLCISRQQGISAI
jgi:RNA polymerase sigma-70 factor (ECF subfamily)